MIRLLLLLIACALSATAQADPFRALSVHPGISSNAHWRNWPDLRLGNPSQYPAYDVIIVNEPEYFGWTGSTWRLPVSSPLYRYNFVQRPNVRHIFQWALDRVAGDSHEKLYFGINEPMPANAGIDVFTGLSLELVGAYAPPNGDHSQRVTIGAGVRWNGRTNWVEINPYAHRFDWCKTTNLGNPNGLPAGTCDPDGRYDRRSFFGGEIVEYTVPGRVGNFAPLVPGAGWTPYWIDWGALIRSYPWTNPPASWDEADVVGVYVGIEGMGKTWAYVRLRDMVSVTLP